MHVIKMNDDKSLMTTVQATIYCGENNADTLLFLIPADYNGTSIANCDVLIEYISPDGEDKTESLECDSELYKGYCQYRLKVDSEFTKYPGRVSLSLDINKNDGGFNLKTGDAFIDVLSQCDEEIPNNKKYELEIKVEKNTEKIDELDKKVSDIDLDDYYTSKDVDKKLEDKADSKDIEEINNSMKDLSDDLEDKASTKDLDEAISALNIKNSKGIDSLRQAPKTEEWTPGSQTIIDFFNANREKYSDFFDENGNVVVKEGAFGDWSAAVSGYGHAGAQHSIVNNRRVIILPEAIGSHGEGNELLIAAEYGHGEGSYNLIGENAQIAHIEGYGNVTHARVSHVGGQYNIVNEGAEWADVAGIGHNVSGVRAFVRGHGHNVYGDTNTVLGWKHMVSGKYQTVLGKKNVDDPTKAVIVGGGNEHQTDDVARRNIYTLDWNGNVWLPGKVKVGGTSQDDINAKTLATLDDIEIAISALVDSSPETLNTLNEVAKALGNDPNFATTIMTLLGEKASTSNVYTKDIIDSKFGEVDTALDTLLSIQSELWGESV